MKKALNILKNILVWTLVVVAVSMMIFTIVSVKTFDRNDRSIFGYKAYTVLSDSMSATDFDAGSIVFVKEVADPSTLKPGDIISYLSQDPNVKGVITHKIRRLTIKDNEPAFITYGTTTDVDDEIPVTYPYVMGKYEFHIPYVGHFFEFLKTTPGYITCIFLPFALLMLYNGVNCVTLFRRYKKEQNAEIEEEKKKLAEEREENAKVLAELRALKAQMEGGIAPQAAAAPAPEQTPAAPAPAEVKAEAPAEPAPAEAKAEAPAAPAPAEVKAEAPVEPAPVEAKAEAPAEPAPAEVKAEAPAEGEGSAATPTLRRRRVVRR